MLAARWWQLAVLSSSSRHGRALPQYAISWESPIELRTVSGIIRGIRFDSGPQYHSTRFADPDCHSCGRVAFSVIAFALERDRLYVGITLIVLAVLLFSLAGGHV